MTEVKLVSNLSDLIPLETCCSSVRLFLDLKRQIIYYALGCVAAAKSEGKRGIASAKGKSHPQHPHSSFPFRACHAGYQVICLDNHHPSCISVSFVGNFVHNVLKFRAIQRLMIT